MALSAKHQKTQFSVGDRIKVHQIIKEADKSRTQVFEGLVIGIKGREDNKSFTVRKIGAHGVGVERIWPLICPSIKKIEVVRKGNVRRAKLYYLRKRLGAKATRVKLGKDKPSKTEEVKEEKNTSKKPSKTKTKKTKKKTLKAKNSKKASKSKKD